MISYLSNTKAKSLVGTALVRLDFNTEDDWRMQAVLPTLRLLLKTSSKIVIMSHRGRPKSGVGSQESGKLSLKKDSVRLSGFLRKKVLFVGRFDFPKIKIDIQKAPKGSILLLENLRFLPGEEKNDPKLAKTLASLGDFYVNDAFAVSHRADASVAAITKFLPSFAGLEFENEIKSLSCVMTTPRHPLVIILGGAKASDKLGVIAYFKKKADCFLLGGGPANTILEAHGMNIGKSLEDGDLKDISIIKKIAAYSMVTLPQDFVWHKNAIVDFGPKTLRAFGKKIAAAKTILWSGPISMIDRKPYDRGSAAIARAIANNKHAFSVAGGGETVMFLKKIHLDKKFSFISTGGGAMMDFLAGEKLPGIEALKKANGQ